MGRWPEAFGSASPSSHTGGADRERSAAEREPDDRLTALDHGVHPRANDRGMLRLLDDQIRRFVDHLAARRLLDETLLVFVADQGDSVGDDGLRRKGVGLPECLVRVPLGRGAVGVDDPDRGRPDGRPLRADAGRARLARALPLNGRRGKPRRSGRR